MLHNFKQLKWCVDFETLESIEYSDLMFSKQLNCQHELKATKQRILMLNANKNVTDNGDIGV